MQIFALKNHLKCLGIFAIISIVLNPSLTSAQEKKQQLEVQDLVVPNAPASAIIGSQISLKPAITPRAFGLNILNSISNEEGEFPNNIAVEVAPYWWTPRPNLTFDDYYNRNGFGQLIYPSLSFSIASEASTIEVDGNEIDVTKLGLGLRLALIAGKANPLIEKAREELRECLNLIEEETKKGNELKQKLNSSVKLNDRDFDRFLETIKLFANSDNVEKERLDDFDDSITKKIEELKGNNLLKDGKKKEELKKVLELIPEVSKIEETNFNEIIDEISFRAGNFRNQQCLNEPNAELRNLDEKARVGFQLESASAVGFNFRENDFDEFRFSNFATWLTASYRGSGDKASPIEFLGVARYTLDDFEDDTNNFFDLGAGLVYRLQETPLAFTLEYVRRFGDEGDDRFVGIADYRINNNYSVFVSYGKDFETDFDGNEDLVTLFGLKVGLGRNAVVNQ